MAGVNEIAGIGVGHAQDESVLTGVTVVLAPEAAVGGVSVRGHAPGTRETESLRPSGMVHEIHAVVLAGGSAFGLAAADGVMTYLREQGIGLNTGSSIIPVVPGAILYDLDLGSPEAPDAAMGYAAASTAHQVAADGSGSRSSPAEGNVGAAVGATVGKYFGIKQAMKGGLGTAAIRLDSGVTVGAVAAVNAFGDVINPETGQLLAAPINPMTGRRISTLSLLHKGREHGDFTAPEPPRNTTLAVIVTDARLSPVDTNVVADSAHAGLARAVQPCHTLVDGDAVFALSAGNKEESPMVVAAVAAQVLSRAIVRAVKQAAPVAGVKTWRQLEEESAS